MEQTTPEHFYDIELYKSLKGKQALQERINNMRLPIMMIDGHPFFVQVRLGQLASFQEDAILNIDLNDLKMHAVTKRLSFNYHLTTRSRIEIAPDITELPKDVVQVTIPNLYYLDPIGMAQVNGKPLTYYHQDGITLRMYRVAGIRPLHKVPELIDIVIKNRQQQGLAELGKPAGKRKPKLLKL